MVEHWTYALKQFLRRPQLPPAIFTYHRDVGFTSGRHRLIRTFKTRLHLSGHKGVRLDAVLGEYAALMSRAERLLLAQLKAGRAWTGDLKVSFYKPLGLSETHLDMAYRQLMAKLSSVAELAKENLKDIDADAKKRHGDRSGPLSIHANIAIVTFSSGLAFGIKFGQAKIIASRE